MTTAVPAPSAIAPAATGIHHQRDNGDRDGAAGESAAKAMGLASGVSCAPSLGEVDASSLCSPAGLVSALVALCALLLDPKTCPPVKRSTALTRPNGLPAREGAALEDATVEGPGAGGFCAAGELAGESIGA